MPIYMDRHDLPGVTAKDVAEAHQKDLKIQEAHGCRALTYWFDEEREVINSSDLFYWPPGHTVKADKDAEVILFSPQHEHSEVIEHMKKKMGL